MARAPLVRYTPPHQRGSTEGSVPGSAAARSLGEVDGESGVYLQVLCSRKAVLLFSSKRLHLLCQNGAQMLHT